MSNRSIFYKSYEISFVVNWLPDLNKCDSEFYIAQYRTGKVSEKKFFPENLHDTEEEAIIFCFQFEWLIIEGVAWIYD